MPTLLVPSRGYLHELTASRASAAFLIGGITMPSQPVSRIRLIQTLSFHGALTRQGTRPPTACIISWTLASPFGACSISIQSQSKPAFDKISATSVEPSVTIGPRSTSRRFSLVLKSSPMRLFNTLWRWRRLTFCGRRLLTLWRRGLWGRWGRGWGGGGGRGGRGGGGGVS